MEEENKERIIKLYEELCRAREVTMEIMKYYHGESPYINYRHYEFGFYEHLHIEICHTIYNLKGIEEVKQYIKEVKQYIKEVTSPE